MTFLVTGTLRVPIFQREQAVARPGQPLQLPSVYCGGVVTPRLPRFGLPDVMG